MTMREKKTLVRAVQIQREIYGKPRISKIIKKLQLVVVVAAAAAAVVNK